MDTEMTPIIPSKQTEAKAWVYSAWLELRNHLSGRNSEYFAKEIGISKSVIDRLTNASYFERLSSKNFGKITKFVNLPINRVIFNTTTQERLANLTSINDATIEDLEEYLMLQDPDTAIVAILMSNKTGLSLKEAQSIFDNDSIESIARDLVSRGFGDLSNGTYRLKFDYVPVKSILLHNGILKKLKEKYFKAGNLRASKMLDLLEIESVSVQTYLEITKTLKDAHTKIKRLVSNDVPQGDTVHFYTNIILDTIGPSIHKQ